MRSEAQISTYVLLLSAVCICIGGERGARAASHCLFPILLCTSVLLCKPDCRTAREKAISAVIKLSVLSILLYRYRNHRLRTGLRYVCAPLAVACVYLLCADLGAIYGCPSMTLLQFSLTVGTSVLGYALLARCLSL